MPEHNVQQLPLLFVHPVSAARNNSHQETCRRLDNYPACSALPHPTAGAFQPPAVSPAPPPPPSPPPAPPSPSSPPPSPPSPNPPPSPRLQPQECEVVNGLYRYFFAADGTRVGWDQELPGIDTATCCDACLNVTR